MDKGTLRKWLQAGYIEEKTLFESRAGTPQGGVISPVIANMALDGLEAAFYASVGTSKLARSKAQLNIVRYADDFVVTGASPGSFCGQSVYGRSRSGTLRREDQDHPYRRRFRLSWPTRAQVRWQTADQASEEKYQIVARQGQGSHQG